MSEFRSADALDALDRVLEEIRREFQANPEFAHRVVKALGADVYFSADDAATLINPVELVATKTPEEVTGILEAMSLSDLKKMVKTWQLGSQVDLSGKSKEEVMEMIEVRARRRLESRMSS